jgi:hypothetical protein
LFNSAQELGGLQPLSFQGTGYAYEGPRQLLPFGGVASPNGASDY